MIFRSRPEELDETDSAQLKKEHVLAKCNCCNDPVKEDDISLDTGKWYMARTYAQPFWQNSASGRGTWTANRKAHPKKLGVTTVQLKWCRIYHWDCIRCEKCGKKLQDDADCVIRDGRVSCHNCEVNFFVKCEECGDHVLDTLGKKYGNKMWHEDCFKCNFDQLSFTPTHLPALHQQGLADLPLGTECGIHLSLGMFHLVDNRLYCLSHGGALPLSSRRVTLGCLGTVLLMML